MQIEFEIADYTQTAQADAVVQLLNAYATDPMGGATPLNEAVKSTLIEKLMHVPGAFSVLGYAVEGDTRTPIALANCFTGFSTFKAKPLINIHDCYVDSNYRGKHVGQLLLAEIERIAKAKGCCKITLEVLQGNKLAQGAYLKFGFVAYALDDTSGQALFWEKPL